MGQDNESRENPASVAYDAPLTAWFLGPKAEYGDQMYELLSHIFRDYLYWRRNYFPHDPAIISRVRRRGHEEWFDTLNTQLDRILNDLKAHFPFYSPRYIAHMLSEQTLPSILGYFAGMLYNPNNVTEEVAPVTVRLELEVGRMVAEMLGYNPRTSWAHLCSGGTVANLEALWVARTVQFLPLVVRDYCVQRDVDFAIRTPNGRLAPIRELDPRQLLSLKPNEVLTLVRRLARHLVTATGKPPREVLDDIGQFIPTSAYDVNRKGFHAVVRRIGLTPVILVSAATHYSVRKAASILGYGEESVRLVPVTPRFRIDVDALRSELQSLGEDEYVAAVIGVVGTTEEGSVDPIHRLRFLRDDLARVENRSFWLHVDAAWGGYIRSLFCGHPLMRDRGHRKLEDICEEYAAAIGAHEKFQIQIKRRTVETRSLEIQWSDPELYAAFLALPDADSVTVDPHKMGYVPYPAGIIAFRSGLVTELITQKAHYISDEEAGVKGIEEVLEIRAIGPYIIEGSKPGAAAAACWLAHKTIPLDVTGHGKIVRETLLNARKLARYLHYHKYLFSSLEEDLYDCDRPATPFTFVPLFEPDTNIVGFVAVPMAWDDGELVPTDVDLARLNALNQHIYEMLSIPTVGRGQHLPYGQPYFISRTRFESDQYAADSIADVLKRLRVTPDDYQAHGLFVLRSTVMNPLYRVAEAEGMDYLFDFVKYLHAAARCTMARVYAEP